MLAGDDFFGQAQRSIQHDKKVLHRLEAHPLAHASGWDLSAAAGRGSGMSPALGGRKWQRKNDKLEKQSFAASVPGLQWLHKRAKCGPTRSLHYSV